MTLNRFPIHLLAIICCAILTSDPICAEPPSQDPQQRSFFLIGNSLTWDTVPAKLAGQTRWHVDCGKSLPYIVANPEMPCVKSSTLWPQALQETQYDVIAIQVHYGSTLEQDVNALAKLIRLQPNANVVIHTGWARSAQRKQEWIAEPIDGKMTMAHNVRYFEAILAELRARFPKREFDRTRAMDVLQQVEQDIENDDAPIESVADLYRDKIHMNVVTGRYLMHNAMRAALGQPRSSVGFEKLAPELKTYLDTVLDRVLNTPR